MAVLTVEGLGKTFAVARVGKAVRAFEDVGFEIHPGLALGVVGSGARTVLQCVRGTIAPDEGTILYQSQHRGLVDLLAIGLAEAARIRDEEWCAVSRFDMGGMRRKRRREGTSDAEWLRGALAIALDLRPRMLLLDAMDCSAEDLRDTETVWLASELKGRGTAILGAFSSAIAACALCDGALLLPDSDGRRTSAA